MTEINQVLEQKKNMVNEKATKFRETRDEWNKKSKTHSTARNELNAEVKFGTLADYFALVDQARPVGEAPKVTGDFFSYSDRVDNYWTGFFNSRAFYKWFDRYLEHWVQEGFSISSYFP